jgi:glycosyltransferase 2 family protein
MNEQPSSGPPRVGRQALLWTLKIVVSGGLLAVLLARVDLARLWDLSRTASIAWLLAALATYFIGIVVSVWRWGILLDAQHVPIRFATRLRSFLVATFFNNFLPSNIGGDVIRIRDTAGPAGSKTLATTVVLVDRGLGLLGLVFVAASGATLAARMSAAIGPMAPGLLWGVLAAAIALAAPLVLLPHGLGKLLRPLRAIHQEWVEERIERLTSALARFRDAPRALGACFAGAIVVQAIIVGFYWAIAHALNLHVPLAHLAIVVPMSLVVQMLPMSVNGFGVREATFGFYFTQLGQPLESALALSFIGAALIMLFSTSGVPFLLKKKTA